MTRPLSPLQGRFVDEYLIDFNATAAAGRAGYSDANYGRQLLTKPNVAAAIAERQAQRAIRAQITQDYVLQRLKHEAELSGEGASHSARVKALETLAKHLGMLIERKQIEVSATLQIIEEIVNAPAPHQNGQAAPRAV